MSKEKQIDRTIEYLNNAINVERNSYFGKGCITMPLIEADKILDILQGYRKQSEWVSVEGDVIFKCSICDAEISTSWDYENDDMWDYCPRCGAKMKGGAE